MPVDPQGGGSWIATNEHALTIALLNYYEADANHSEEPKRSRGLLVKDLAACKTLLQAENYLHAAQVTEYAPFHLLVFAGVQHPIWWSWNGSQLQQRLLTTGVLSTSAWGSRWVPELRAQYLQRHLHTMREDSEHLQLMRQSKPYSNSIAVAMQRTDAMTVSTTVIKVTSADTQLTYYEGHPSQQSHGNAMFLVRHKSALHTPVAHDQSTWVTRIQFKTLFQEKAPQLAQSLPSIAFPLLRWVLRERALNSLLSRFDYVAPEQFCDTALREIGVNVNVEAERWPEQSERPVFLSNHPSGGLDGIVLIAMLKKRYPDLKVVANDVLQQIEHMKDWVIPVNVFGNAKRSLSNLQKAFDGVEPILMFPAGKTARRNALGELDDGDWSGVPVKLAARHERTVVPLFLQAYNSKTFDFIAKWRQRAGIKMNIEMLLLVRELMKPACRQFRVHQYSPLQPKALVSLLAQQSPGMAVKEMSYALRKGV